MYLLSFFLTFFIAHLHLHSNFDAIPLSSGLNRINVYSINVVYCVQGVFRATLDPSGCTSPVKESVKMCVLVAHNHLYIGEPCCNSSSSLKIASKVLIDGVALMCSRAHQKSSVHSEDYGLLGETQSGTVSI